MNNTKPVLVIGSLIFPAFLLFSTASTAATAVYESGTMEFSTTEQSMWGGGDGITPQSVTWSTSWNDSDTIGDFVGSRTLVPGTGISITNPAYTVWKGSYDACKAIEIVPGSCRNIWGNGPSKTIWIPAQYIDTRFGLSATFSSDGMLSLTNEFGVNGGTIDAAYEFDARMEYPTQVDAGEFFSLSPTSSMNEKELVTFFPAITGRMSAGMEVDVGYSYTECLIIGICSSGGTTIIDWDIDPEFFEINTPNLDPDSASVLGLDDWAFDVTRLTVYADLDVTNGAMTVSLPGFPRPLAGINVAQLDLDAPASDVGDAGTFSGGVLQNSNNFEDVVTLDVDMDVQATVPLPPLGAVFNLGPFTFRGDIVDIGMGPTMDLDQDIELDTTLMMRLDFDLPVIVRNHELPGERQVTSITAPFNEFPEIALIDSQPVNTTPTFFLKSVVDNNTDMTFDLSFFTDILKGKISFSLFTLADYCLICDTNNLTDISTISLYNDEFNLEGFTEITGASFILKTNNPPVFSHVPADRDIEGNTTGGASSTHEDILAFLAEVTATDIEDDDETLLIEYAPSLPDLLPLNGAFPITFTVTDSVGDTDTATAVLTIVDTTPPEISIDSFMTVAEDPTGSEVPDAAGLISAWLDSATVSDTVDEAPFLDFSVSSPLMLGDNAVTYIARDTEGNETEVTTSVYLKTPWSLYAEEGLYIKKDSNILSGMVISNGTTTEKGKFKKAAAIIGKSSYLGELSPLFADSIYVDKRSYIENAYYSDLSGKGSIGNSYLAVQGISNPYSQFPDFTAGSTDIQVGCKRCILESGTVLQPGEYANLGLDKGKRNRPVILYLTGGIYSFHSIFLDKYTQLRVLAPSLVQVESNVIADDNVIIGPNEGSLGGASLTILVRGDDLEIDFDKNRLDKYKDDDKEYSDWMKEFDDNFSWGRDKNDSNNSFSDKKHKNKNEKKRKTLSKLNSKSAPQGFRLGKDSNLQADVIVPNGNILIKKQASITGSLYGKYIFLEDNSKVEFGEGI